MGKTTERKRRRWLWAAIGVVVIVLGVGGYLVFRSNTPTVVVATVQLQNMQNTIFASGTVKPAERQVVQAAELTAPVGNFAVGIGTNVQVGQVLLTMASAAQTSAVAAAQSAVQNAEGALATAQAQYQAAPPILQPQLMVQVNAAQAQLASAKAQLSQSQAAMSATQIRASIAGKVLMENQTGLANDGTPTPIIEVASTTKQIDIEVSEVDGVQIHPGMQATLTTDAFPGQTWQATVSSVADYATVDQTGSGQVEVILKPARTLPVPYGYQVDVNIMSALHKAVPVIPYDALVQNGDSYQVFVVQGSRVHAVPVTLGITNNTAVEVTKGLTVGNQVVLDPPSTLADGDAVTVS